MQAQAVCLSAAVDAADARAETPEQQKADSFPEPTNQITHTWNQIITWPRVITASEAAGAFETSTTRTSTRPTSMAVLV